MTWNVTIWDCRSKPGLAYHCGWALRVAALLTGVVILAGGMPRADGQPTAPTEDQVKAAFVVNFAKYVVWPDGVFARPDSPIVIATLGETGLTAELRRMVPGKTTAEHPMTFKVLQEDDARDCHILFVPVSARHVPALLEKLRGSRVLTVGENDDFLARGGIINLTRRERKIRLQVNLEAARPQGLKISSKLLGVAEIVKVK